MRNILSFLRATGSLWAVALLVAFGFLFFPENPALPSFVVVAVTVPLALIGAIVVPIILRREQARAEAADEEYYEEHSGAEDPR